MEIESGQQKVTLSESTIASPAGRRKLSSSYLVRVQLMRDCHNLANEKHLYSYFLQCTLCLV